MTAQQEKKSTFWSKVSTGAATICTTAIIWFGSYQVRIYNAILLQPKIDETQTAAILNIIADIKDLKGQTEFIKNEQTRQAGKIIYLEAIMPDKNQFKIKR